MRVFIVSFFLSILCFSFKAQTFKGEVKDKSTQKGISYVNIGIPSKGYGVISNEDGVFSITITSEHDTDIVQVSSIGYATAYYNVSQLKKLCSSNTPLMLTEAIYELATTTVRPNEYETEVMGAKKVEDLECVSMEKFAVKDTALQRFEKEKGLTDKSIGIEMGNKIKIDKGQQTFIDKIQFKTCVGPNDTAIYRVNIYSEGKTLKRAVTPLGIVKVINSENVLKSPIIVTTIGKTEVHSINVSQQNIEVSDDFVVALECIYASDKKMNIGADASVFGSTDLLIRPSVMNEWIKIPLVDVTFISATVTYKKKKGLWSRLFD